MVEQVTFNHLVADSSSAQSTTNLHIFYIMEPLLTYRGSFVSEENAKKFVSTLINGAVTQQVGNIWHVWQCNF